MPTPGPESTDDIDKEYLEAAAVSIEAKVTEELFIHPNSLLPRKALFECYLNEMQQEFATFRRRQNNGALKLAQSLTELIEQQPELFTQEVFDEIEQIAALSDKIASDEMGYSEHIAKGGSLQEFAGVSDAAIDKLYQAAKQLYEQKRYDDASDAFYFLVGLNPEFTAFWLGLANAEFHCKRYKEALAAYSNATQAGSYNPIVHLSISQCYQALQDKDSAINTLDVGLTIAQSNVEYTNCTPSLEDEKLRLQNAG